MKPYPIKFQPVFQERVWGGRELERFGYSLPKGHIGEGWMISDHPNGITQACNGPLKGMGLDEIRETYGKELFGTKNPSHLSRFPLLIKLLDCKDDLSVQVHPNDHYEKLPPGELGKTEMWYVLDAKPDAKIIYGLKSEYGSRDKLAKLIEEDRILEGLQQVDVKAGDAFYIPAGTVHALGKGVLVAEIQQNSDTTYRLYDYNRPGLDGKPRELHVEDSLNVISYSNENATHTHTDQLQPKQWMTLASSPYFLVELGTLQDKWEMNTTPDSFVIHIICEGTGTLEWNDDSLHVSAGDCFLLPANLGAYQFAGNIKLLRAQLA